MCGAAAVNLFLQVYRAGTLPFDLKIWDLKSTSDAKEEGAQLVEFADSVGAGVDSQRPYFGHRRNARSTLKKPWARH